MGISPSDFDTEVKPMTPEMLAVQQGIPAKGSGGGVSRPVMPQGEQEANIKTL